MTRGTGTVHMVPADGQIVMVARRWRSKWWRVVCTCGKSRRRKDGSCRHERAVFALLQPEIKTRAKIGKARFN